jgi:hypothetical protein
MFLALPCRHTPSWIRLLGQYMQESPLLIWVENVTVLTATHHYTTRSLKKKHNVTVMTATHDCNTKSPTETITISSSMFHSLSTHNVNSKNLCNQTRKKETIQYNSSTEK